MQKGRKENREESSQKGREEKEKIVLNRLKLKADLDFISKATSLTKEEIKNLQSKKKELDYLPKLSLRAFCLRPRR